MSIIATEKPRPMTADQAWELPFDVVYRLLTDGTEDAADLYLSGAFPQMHELYDSKFVLAAVTQISMTRERKSNWWVVTVTYGPVIVNIEFVGSDGIPVHMGAVDSSDLSITLHTEEPDLVPPPFGEP